MKISSFVGAFLCTLAMLGATPAAAASLAGQTFVQTSTLANTELTLNGLGLRSVFIIRGYVAGLYLVKKSNSGAEVVAMAGPKRLQLRMLRQASAEDFNQALVSGIRDNATPTQVLALQERVDQLLNTIVGIGGTVSGDVINFDYTEAQGTTLFVNGKQRGVAIAGSDFYAAVLSIFVGDKPVDTRLKQGLLGG